MDFKKFKREVHPVEGCGLFCRSLTYGEFIACQKHLKAVGDERAAAVICCHTLSDKQGNRLLGDDDLGDVDNLPVHVVAAVNRVFDRLMTFNPDAAKKV